ncbi:MAG: hypothetical protein L0Y72_23035 [Gemmataceae bacterium]|nr:hypothetical protein [Gemmataceae bacterium]
MICPMCYGKRMVQIRGVWMPCPECAGLGDLHCCDGLQAQPGDDQAQEEKHDVIEKNDVEPS